MFYSKFYFTGFGTLFLFIHHNVNKIEQNARNFNLIVIWLSITDDGYILCFAACCWKPFTGQFGWLLQLSSKIFIPYRYGHVSEGIQHCCKWRALVCSCMYAYSKLKCPVISYFLFLFCVNREYSNNWKLQLMQTFYQTCWSFMTSLRPSNFIMKGY